MTHLPKARKRKRRVAGYARVSTDSDEQLTSYQSQVNYHTKMIEANLGWEFVRIYADEGISGTGTKNRVGFNTMIKDEMAAKFGAQNARYEATRGCWHNRKPSLDK